jgi:hypothetical protein
VLQAEAGAQLRAFFAKKRALIEAEGIEGAAP